MTTTALEITNLRKRYGQKVAVDDLSLRVNEGEIFGILGPNGAGKTTTVECAEGLRRPDGGTVQVFGIDPYRDRTEAHGQWSLRGELEVRGVARMVEVRLGAVSEHDGVLRAAAQVAVDRYDFGLTAYRGLAARGLTVGLDITAHRESAS